MRDSSARTKSGIVRVDSILVTSFTCANLSREKYFAIFISLYMLKICV